MADQAVSPAVYSEDPYERFWTLSIDMLCIAGFDGYFKLVNPAFEQTLGLAPAELLGHPFIDFVHPEDRASTLAEVEKLGTGALTVHFENRYRCQDGTYRWLAWTAFPFVVESRIYAVARDITDWKQAAEEQRRLLLQEHRGQQETETLATISQVLAREDLEHVLQLVVEAAQHLVNADMAQIALPVAPGILQIVALVGERTNALRGFVLRPGTGVVGEVMKTGRPYQVENYGTAESIEHDPLLDQAVAAEAVVSVLGVPIRRGPETLDVFWVYSRTQRDFTPAEIGLLERLASQAAVAMEKARFQGQEQVARAELQAAERRAALLELTQACEHGEIEGIALRTEPDACSVCENAARDVYAPRLVPPLPLVGCASSDGCRCIYSPPGFDPYRRPPPIPAEHIANLDIPRKLRDAALFGSEMKRSCNSRDLAEYLDTFPLLPFPPDLTLHPGEAAYLVRPVRRMWERREAGNGAPSGPSFPLAEPLPAWLKRVGRPPHLPVGAVAQWEEGLVYLTNWRLLFSIRGAMDSILLADLVRIEYFRDALACTVGARSRRLILHLDDALQVGLCMTRAVRDIAVLLPTSS